MPLTRLSIKGRKFVEANKRFSLEDARATASSRAYAVDIILFPSLICTFVSSSPATQGTKTGILWEYYHSPLDL